MTENRIISFIRVPNLDLGETFWLLTKLKTSAGPWKKNKKTTTLVIQSRKKSCALVDLKASRSSFKMKHLHQHQVRRGLLLFACEAKSIFLNSPHDYVHCENQWISASDIRQLLYRYNILICRQVCRNLTSCCKFQRSKLVLKTSKLYFIV